MRDCMGPMREEHVTVANSKRTALFEVGTGEPEPTLCVFTPSAALIFNNSAGHLGVPEAQTPDGFHSQLQLLH